MKKFNFQLFMLACIIFSLAGISDRKASAYKIKVEVEKNGPYAEKVGDEMFALAKKAAKRDIKRCFGDKNGILNRTYLVGMDVKKKDTFTLCKPYVYWSDSSYLHLYPEYKFPVAVKGKIVALIEVYGRMEELEYVSADIPTNYYEYEDAIKRLNDLDYLHKDYVFFRYEGSILAQREDGKIKKFLEFSYEEPSDGERFFHALDYDKKLELTLEQMDDFMTHEELMALHEKNFDPNPIIGGTDSGEKAVKTIKQADTAKPDTSIEKNFNISYGILSVSVAVGVVVLAVAFTIIRKKRNDKG